MSARARTLRGLPNERWGPLRQHQQSRYVEGLCERCGGRIATNEVHLTRAWRHGPAELCEHIICPVPPETW